MSLTFEEIERIVERITYKPGWTFSVDHERVGTDRRPYLQVQVDETAEAALCPFTGKVIPWKGGKRYLSYHMCRQEVVGAVLGVIKDAEQHETHEWFKYKGYSIYNPHTDPDALVDVVRFKRNLNMRDNAMTMEES